MNVVSDEGDHSGPIELTMMFLIVLVILGCPEKVMVMVGMQDIQSDVLIVRDIEQSL